LLDDALWLPIGRPRPRQLKKGSFFHLDCADDPFSAKNALEKVSFLDGRAVIVVTALREPKRCSFGKVGIRSPKQRPETAIILPSTRYARGPRQAQDLMGALRNAAPMKGSSVQLGSLLGNTCADAVCSLNRSDKRRPARSPGSELFRASVFLGRDDRAASRGVSKQK